MLTFVNNKVCPYGHRVWLTLLELGIPFEERLCTLKPGHKEPWFTELYQKSLGANAGSDGKVPVIDDNGFVLSESAVIAEYLASKYGPATGKNLLSHTPEEKAFATIFLEHTLSLYQKAFYGLLREQDEAKQAALKSDLLSAIKKLSEELNVHNGPFLLGEKLTLTDLLVYPFIERLVAAEHYRAFSVPGEESFHAFFRFRDAMQSLPSVKAAAQEADFYIEQYRPFVEGKI